MKNTFEMQPILQENAYHPQSSGNNSSVECYINLWYY
jgi:hypothetical protein